MRFLRSLGEGDRFRVAHPKQSSLNERTMPRDQVYRVKRVYPMAPYMTIAENVAQPNDGFYSLGPGTPILLPMEFDPSEDEIFAFLSPRIGKKRVIAYRILWDGKANLHRVIKPGAIAALNLLFSLGKSEYSPRELPALFRKHYARFLGRAHIGNGYATFVLNKRIMVDRGLLEEIVDDGPLPGAIREANLQEVI